MKKIYTPSFLFLYLLFATCQIVAQSYPPKSLHAGELQLALKKLNVLGSVLYIAAHPDDENTALIAWFANDRLMRTSYLSLTRGDGGQNLIGAEQSELMGFIRTHELIQARRTDGGEQYFTRANDFGFSKDAKESFEIWGKDKILADVVWTIRKLKPDVIITRFPPTREAGHGHHEASALLAMEAFKAAADPKMFPEQLKYVQTWQAKRLTWNVFSVRRGNFTNVPNDSSKTVKADIGSYNALLGKSHLVVAAESRSMHKSQGFGSAKARGNRIDYLQHMDGDLAQKDILDGLDISWKRIKVGEEIGKLLNEAYQKFEAEHPSKIVPILMKAYNLMLKYPKNDEFGNYWIDFKKEELQNIIAQCMGLWLEANASEYWASAGDSVQISIEAVKRSDIPLNLQKIAIRSLKNGIIASVDSLPKSLQNGNLFNPKIKTLIPANEAITQPYWLKESPEKGIFKISEADKHLLGTPENTAPLQVIFEIKLENQIFTFIRPVTYKWTKPDEGELYRSFEIIPEVMVNLDHENYLFASQEPKEIQITVKAGKANIKDELRIELPEGWRTEPKLQAFELRKKEEEKTLTFKIFPPQNPSKGALKVLLKSNSQNDNQTIRGIRKIDYLHIPQLLVYPTAEANVEKFDIKINDKNIAYIDGAGDEIPQYLRQIGYSVTLLTDKEMKEDLSKYSAVIVGIRAYNTEERLKFYQEKLMSYVQNGGILMVQYQTNFRLVTPQIGPYPFAIGRERVTVEEAPIKFLKPEHPILNYPNKITQKDFEGWVQERGLYFAQTWDKNYQTILGLNDPAEKELEGGLLYAEYGKGRFIYTGLSFFREIPAGVSGAYRFFVNLISKEAVK